MELYSKTVDFDEYWDNLRECTRRLIAGDVCLNKNDWNNRISYLLYSIVSTLCAHAIASVLTSIYVTE